MKERIQRIGSQRDVVAASRAGLAVGRHAGLSLVEQYSVAALLTELGRELVRRSESAICVIRDESDERGPRVLVELTGQGDGLPNAARQMRSAEGMLPRWLLRLPVRSVDLRRDGDGARLSVAMGALRPRTPAARLA